MIERTKKRIIEADRVIADEKKAGIYWKSIDNEEMFQYGLVTIAMAERMKARCIARLERLS